MPRPQSRLPPPHADASVPRAPLLQVFIRLAMAKFGKGQVTWDISDCIQMLCDHCLSVMPPTSTQDANTFRKERLYTEDTCEVLEPLAAPLKVVYETYRSDGTRASTTLMTFEAFERVLKDGGVAPRWIDDAQILVDVFRLSRMLRVDEFDDRPRAEQLSFLEFLEALARLAAHVQLPTHEQLEEMECAPGTGTRALPGGRETRDLPRVCRGLS